MTKIQDKIELIIQKLEDINSEKESIVRVEELTLKQITSVYKAQRGRHRTGQDSSLQDSRCGENSIKSKHHNSKDSNRQRAM